MAATKLAFTTQPTGYTSEGVLTTQPVVTAQNSDNSTDTSFTGVVTLVCSVASSRFYTTTELIATSHTVQSGSTTTAILVSPALSFPTTLPADYDGRGYTMHIKTVLGSTYSAATAYNIGDYAITDGVNSYRCIAATTGNAPPNATYWVLEAIKFQRRTVSGNTGTGQLDVSTAFSAVPTTGITVEVHSGVIPVTVAATCVAGVATFTNLAIMGWEDTALVASSTGLTDATSDPMSPTGTRDGPAELPRVTVDTSEPTIDGVTVTCGPTADYTDLQDAIDARVSADSDQNDAIVLQASATLAGNYILTKKATGTGVIVIKGHVDPCTEGTRVSPTDISANSIAKVEALGTNGVAFRCDPGAHHWRLQGFEITMNSAASYCGGLINTTDRASETAGTGLLADVPTHIVLDRLYLHGDSTKDCKFGVRLGSATTGMVDCYTDDIHSATDTNSLETQAVGGFAGPGPYRIHNNRLVASTENLMFGGSDPYVAGVVPTDVTITNNYLYKPLAWISTTIKNNVKNLFELKCIRRALVEGNVLENCWKGAQTGSSVLFTPVNQTATAVNAGVRDVTFRKNVVRNSSAGYNITMENSEKGVPSIGLWRLRIHDTVLWNVNDPVEIQNESRLASLFDECCDVWFRHNTLLGSVNATNTKAVVFDQASIPALRAKYDDNLTTAESYAFLSTGGTPGGASVTSCILNGGGTFDKNALINLGASAGAESAFPASTEFPADNSAVGFTTVGITSTWDADPIDDVLAALTLDPTSDFAAASGWLDSAGDAVDMGADMTAVRTAVTGVVDGTPGTEPAQTADHLALTAQPSASTVSGTAHAVQPAGVVEDDTDATVTDDTSTVTASWVSETGTGTAGGTLTAVAVAGVWAFTNLFVTSAAGCTGHWTFTDGALTGVDSDTITITAVPVVVPTRLRGRRYFCHV